MTYVLTAGVVLIGGLLAFAIWMWFETGDFSGGLLGRLFLITVALICATIVFGVAAIAVAFVMPIVVGLIGALISLIRWIARQRAAR